MRSLSMIESRTLREPPDWASERSTLLVLTQARDWSDPCDPCQHRTCRKPATRALLSCFFRRCYATMSCSTAVRMGARIPGARFVVLERCGHLPTLERPDAT